MTSMFKTSPFENVGDLSLWSVSSVQEMMNMFTESKLLNIGDISDWNVSNVYLMDSMFYMSSFKNVGDLGNQNICSAEVIDVSYVKRRRVDVYKVKLIEKIVSSKDKYASVEPLV